MKTSLYNNDGTLSTQAQSLLSVKPLDMSMAEWRKLLKEFRGSLSLKDLKEFNRLTKKVQSKAYHEANKEKANTYRSVYYQANKEKERARNKRYYETNKKKITAYREANKEHIRNQRKAYRQANPNKFNTPRNKIRRSVQRAFERIGKNKPTNTLQLLGCSWEEAKAHIENLWQEGMSWDNHGKYGWHIDHIRPVSSFEDHELDQMNHISNLQPLWATDNLSKSNKW